MADLLTDFGTSGGPGDCIVSEASGFRSRDVVTIAANTAVSSGDILGKLTSGGNFVPLNPVASDGSQNAVCIALQDLASNASVKPMPVLARSAEFNASEVGPTALTDTQKKAAFVQLKALGLIPSASIVNPTLARPTPNL